MYNEFYGFSEKPFELTPDPKFLYFTSSHRKVLSSLVNGVRNRKSFITVIGEVGTGKTTLVHSLLNNLDEKVKTAFVFHTTITFNDLLRIILWELGLIVREEGATGLLHQLIQYLTQIAARGESVAIIIDEAQNLSQKVLEEIQMFHNLQPRLTQFILVGQPELEDKLNSEVLRQLRQSIEIRCQIRALNEKESEEYIDHRLKLVGSSTSGIFTQKAIFTICSSAWGIPRIINVLCDNALLKGYSLSKKKIDVDIIREVIKDIKGPSLQRNIFSSITTALREFRPSPIRLKLSPKKVSLAILSLICLGGLILLTQGYLQRRPANTWKIESLKSLKLPQPITLPLASAPSTRELDKLKEVVTVEEGQTLYYMAQKYYHMANTTLIDLILDCNPEITNANLIISNQKIKISKITEELLILQDTDHTYKIHVGTFQNSSFVRFYRNEPVLKGKVIEVFSRRVSPKDNWYRVVVGPFANKEDCLKVIDQLKGKGLLPVFGGILKAE